ncbi:ArsA-related P-loop ATPase [Streptomyces sp. NPDC050610]|uniref:ArsA family ATPase n=1 Tax=Streptomyces sp. NPDC050610 TaxID=3157097 RepID=UPI00342049B9
MRTVLVTGTGGAGRTTVAAATALAAAREGSRTLLLTADRGPVPGAVLAADLPAESLAPVEPIPAAPGLWAARIDADVRFRGHAQDLQERGASLFDLLGAAPFDAEELTELPGAEALATLAALRSAHTDGGWDLIVVDAPPAAETARLLALPEQLRRYLRRLLPTERQAARALRPMLAQLVGVPMPAQKLYEHAEHWERELAAVQGVIESASTTVRLVVEPGAHAAEALRAARAGLALQGCRIDAVVANRLLPTGSADPFLAALSGRQQTALKEIHEEYGQAAATVCELPHLGRDIQGPDDAAELAGRCVTTAGGASAAPGLAPGTAGPDDRAADPWTVEDRLSEDGVLVWLLPLPGARREGLDLVRRGDELIVSVSPFRRVLPLPSALRRCTVSGAGLRDGVLRVRFTPDPALWPKSF